MQYLVTPIEGIISSMMAPFTNALGTFAGSAIESMTAMNAPIWPLDVKRPLEVVASVATGFIGVTVGLRLLDALHPFKSLIGESTIALIYGFMGYEVFTTAFWRPVMSNAVETPMRYWAQLQFRTHLVDHELADHEFFQGVIDKDAWTYIHRVHGWPEDQIKLHYDSMEQHPNLYTLIKIADAMPIDPEYARRVLTINGYRDPDLTVLLELLTRRPLVTELNGVRSQLLATYVDGQISRDELKITLRKIGVRDAEITLLLVASDMKVQAAKASAAARALQDLDREAAADLKAAMKARRDVLVAAFQRDLLTDAEFVEQLLAVGVSEDLAGALLDLELLRKIPKPRRTTS